MLFLIVGLAGAAIVGALINKYGFTTVVDDFKADLEVVVADVKAELAKVSPDLAALKTKVEALLAKIGL